jgi:hypothetical protein
MRRNEDCHQEEGDDVSEDGVGPDEVDPVVVLILPQRRGSDFEVGDVARPAGIVIKTFFSFVTDAPDLNKLECFASSRPSRLV